ncbi:putative PTS IIA-like nitrogen-regulatory protein PtsN [Anaeromyxobacter sp. K]|uniref:PTS IIA-like nitrogen-regulatory protein PtsN n=1 Tax=Anaeromyxobacter dehalogenans (strain ATCC BAA-258 / DSM 21875 / 2CP-1) TaxID=455488 RepID=B8JBM7_ANAD2|nr:MULTISPECIES: PTS sugar transporter subunit IIA [Anaeromyxobacter]ACG75499.1 putative PTS IIA-like nitrogen-regulatory protein PtsN [Anaeromyxobacter sp. K]ACL67635.1 putative PTS IIA-like nitrogen-regulatory protein PtsN [Anaeromyxobacter dehalogenans 2CP-1]
MKIVEFLRSDAVIASLSGQAAPAVLAELVRPLAASQKVDGQRLVETLLDREKLGSTGIGEGVAIPHGKVPGLPGLMASFGRSAGGVDFRAIDGKPTHLFFALFAPENSAGTHLKALARISRIFKNPAFREAIMKAPDAAEIYRLIEAEDAKY